MTTAQQEDSSRKDQLKVRYSNRIRILADGPKVVRRAIGKPSDNGSKETSSMIEKNQLVSGYATKKSSYKEHRVDALAPYAEEGRGKLRKATGSRKQALIRRYPNGGTRQVKNLSP